MTRISACVIVRDEERNLPQWLASVRDLSDEMVVVDTGSVDRTRELAKKGGARVEEFKWRDDFSAAKNYALGCCKGKWVVMLDADEYFPEGDIPKVRALIERYHGDRSVLGFLFQRINIDRDNYGFYQSSGPQIRVFRNLPDLRYHGRIHENLRYEGPGNGRMLFSKEAVIYHTGYSSSLLRAKQERNLALLKREEAEGRGEGLEFYFADCYYGLQDYARAADYARRGIENGLAVAVGDDCRPFQIWIEGLMLKGGSREEICFAVERAKEAHPEAARFDFLSGLDAWERKDYLGATRDFLSGMAIADSKEKNGVSPLGGTGQEKYLADACCKLAQLAHWRHKDGEALDWAHRALREERYNVRAFRMFMELVREAPPVDVIEALNAIYDRKGDAPFLVRNLDWATEGRVRLYYMGQAGMEPGEFEQYWLAGRTMAAAAAAAEDMDALCRLGLCFGDADSKERISRLVPECYRKASLGQANTPRITRVQRSMEKEREKMMDEKERLSDLEVAALSAILKELVKRNSSNAVDVAERLLKARPSRRDVMEQLAALYCYLRDMKKMVEVSTLFPREDALGKYLRAAGVHMEDPEEAERLCTEIVAQGGLPRSWSGREHELLAILYDSWGDLRKSSQELLQASRSMASLEHKIEKFDHYLMATQYFEYSPEVILRETLRFQEFFRGVHPFGHGRQRRHRKLRIGYLSPNFRYSVDANFTHAIFEASDRSKFEIYCYAKCREDDFSRDMAKKVDVWRNVADCGTEEMARIIYEDEVDILMELAGHTGRKTLPVLAYRPAPIQISGIGYVATTGLPAVDYYLVDNHTAPRGEERYFTEKLLRLPHSHCCYTQILNPGVPVFPMPCEKNGYVTFGCMNQINRVGDDVLAAWGRIMRLVPDSRLYLKQRLLDNPKRRAIEEERLERFGIAMSRVTMEGYTQEFLASYRNMDIALDTFPYTGGATTCDALYMGIPVISLAGGSHHGRFGLTILANMGLSELCGDTVDEYIDCAVGLARDRERLRKLHEGLRERMEKSPVMDQKLYMKDLESAYEEIWMRYETGEA